MNGKRIVPGLISHMVPRHLPASSKLLEINLVIPSMKPCGLRLDYKSSFEVIEPRLLMMLLRATKFDKFPAVTSSMDVSEDAVRVRAEEEGRRHNAQGPIRGRSPKGYSPRRSLSRTPAASWSDSRRSITPRRGSSPEVKPTHTADTPMGSRTLSGPAMEPDSMHVVFSSAIRCFQFFFPRRRSTRKAPAVRWMEPPSNTPVIVEIDGPLRSRNATKYKAEHFGWGR